MRRPRMDLNREFAALIELIYECATDPDRWPTFLDRLTGATNSRGATILLHDFRLAQGHSAWDYGFDPRLAAEYPSWAAENVYFREGGNHLRTGVVARGEDVVDDRFVRKTAFFNEYLRQVDTMHHVAACVFREQPIVALLLAQKAINQPSHTNEEMRLMESLLPHVQRSVIIQRRLAIFDRAREASAHALDLVPVGVCLLDAQKRVVLANRAARAVFDQNDGLSLTVTGITAGSSTASALLSKMIGQACQGQTIVPGVAPSAILVPRRSGRRSFALFASAIRLTLLDISAGAATAIVLIVDPDRKAEGAEQIMARLYGLTPREAAVARMLLDGETVEQINGTLQVSSNTTRTYLKRVFAKTGVRGQADLVRRLAISVATALAGVDGSSDKR